MSLQAGVLRPAVTCGYTLPFQRAGAATDATSLRVDTCKWIVDVHGIAIVDTGGPQKSWPAPIERMAAAAASQLSTFPHAEAASGIVLVAAAATALVWVKGSDFPFEEHLVTSAVDQFGRLVSACLDGLPRRLALFCSRLVVSRLCTKSAVTSPPGWCDGALDGATNSIRSGGAMLRVQRPSQFQVCVCDPALENGVCHPFRREGTRASMSR
jgi:hypothetical protein